MKPTIGRIVWWWQDQVNGQPEPAIITRVISDDQVTLTVFQKDGTTSGRVGVYFWNGGPPSPIACFAQWPDRD